MPYQTGAASDPADLLADLGTFAAANGWTVSSPTSGKVFSKGSAFCGVVADADSLDSRGCISYDSGLAWNAQPGHSGVTHSCNLGAGPFTAYHFYAESEESKSFLGAVVEISAGVYRHWVLGDLIKYGAWTGGTYSDSVFHDTTSDDANRTTSANHRYLADTIYGGTARGQFYCNVDGLTDNWVKIAASSDIASASSFGTGCVRGDGKWIGAIGSQYQKWNLRTPLFPLELFVNRPSSLRSIVGRVPALRHVSLRNYMPGEILSIGGDDWQLWPVVARTDTSGSSSSTTPSSGYYGYAYLRT
jgi:hypothetical protein